MKLFPRFALVAALTAGVCLRAGLDYPRAALAQVDSLPAPDTSAAPADTAAASADTTLTPPDTSVVALDTVAVDTTAADTTAADTTVVDSIAAPGAQPGTHNVDVVISARVDTTDATVRAVVKLWLDYLGARADGSDGGQYWDPREVKRWDAFNLSAVWVFQNPRFFEVYRPTVLSVERFADNLYAIRTLFYGEGLPPSLGRQNPWAITRQFAEFDDATHQWWLRNPLGVMTREWMRSKVRHITFVYPPTHEFRLERAVHAATFCDSIANAFPFIEIRPFEFYITDSPELLDIMIGLEYSLNGFPETRTMVNHGMLFTARGDEWQPHALASMVVAGQRSPDPVVATGFPAWVGGWNGATYAENMRGVAAWMQEHPEVTFDDLVSHPSRYDLAGLEYVPGAVMCDLAYMLGGGVKVQRLFVSRAAGGLYGVIQDAFGVDRDNFQFMFRTRVKELR